MKYNLKNTVFDMIGAAHLANICTQREPQNPESGKDVHAVLTWELQNVSVKEFFT